MLEELLAGGIAGVGASSLAEWGIHTHFMHRNLLKRDMFHNRQARSSHNDNHHASYTARKFFRSEENKDAVLHIGWRYGVLALAPLAAVSAGAIGTGISSLSGLEQLPLITGIFAGEMAYVGLYESFHHAFHAQGRLRDTIHAELGAAIMKYAQLPAIRLSQPFIMELDRSIEDIISNPKSVIEPPVVDRLIFEVNRLKGGLQHLKYIEANKILYEVAQKAGEKEQEHRSSLHGIDQLKDAASRAGRFVLNRVPAVSQFYDSMARHHLVHHRSVKANLNVVLYAFDFLFHTKNDSSKDFLIKDETLWIELPKLPVYSTKAQQPKSNYINNRARTA